MAMMDSLETSNDRFINHLGLTYKWPKLDAVK